MTISDAIKGYNEDAVAAALAQEQRNDRWGSAPLDEARRLLHGVMFEPGQAYFEACLYRNGGALPFMLELPSIEEAVVLKIRMKLIPTDKPRQPMTIEAIDLAALIDEGRIQWDEMHAKKGS